MMKMLSKIKLLKEIKIQAKNIFYCTFVFLVFLNINDVLAQDRAKCFRSASKPFYVNDVAETDAMKKKKAELQTLFQQMDKFCDTLLSAGMEEEDWWDVHNKYTSDSDGTVQSFLSTRPTLKAKYDEFLEKFEQAEAAIAKQRVCDDNPYSCMDKTARDDLNTKFQTAKQACSNSFQKLKSCDASFSANDPCNQVSACDSKVKKNGSCNSNDISTFNKNLSNLCSLGQQLFGNNYGTLHMVNFAATVEGDYYAYAPTSAWKDSELAQAYKGNEGEAGLNQVLADEAALNPRSNAGFCDIKGLKESYMGNCYSCTIVAALISTFMDVADKTAPLTQQAGVRLMIIGMFLWIAFYVLKQMASLVMPEPMKMVQDLLKFFFKCLIAYTLITSGISVVSKMLVEPLLSFGAEYGNTIIDVTTPKIADIDKYGKFDTKDYNSNLISEAIFGKIMTLSKKADAAVSLNFVIGDALACHAHHAGAITVAKKVQEILHIEFYFPDFWLWLCGIAIWFMGLMVVIGINFYLLDLSFKVGFGLLALPITLGLWPFDKFQNKFTECIRLIINAAGTFMFLGISVGITVTLISAALGGTDELFAAIENDNKRYVADQFSLSGAKFLLVAFAFFYSHKLISETVSGLTDKFFGSSLAGGMNHMHTMAVGTTSYLGNAVKDKVGGTVSKIANGIGKGADALTGKAMGGAIKGLKKGGRAIGRLAGKLK